VGGYTTFIQRPLVLSYRAYHCPNVSSFTNIVCAINLELIFDPYSLISAKENTLVLVPWYWIFLQQLIDYQVMMKPLIMEPECPSPSSQNPPVDYLEPAQSI
jgi:hypothetical protein